MAADATDLLMTPAAHSTKHDATSELGPSREEKPIESEAKPTRSMSLKRKRAVEEEEDSAGLGYPHNLASIYPPKKRSRTPSSESDASEETLVESPASSTAPIESNKPIDATVASLLSPEEATEIVFTEVTSITAVAEIPGAPPDATAEAPAEAPVEPFRSKTPVPSPSKVTETFSTPSPVNITILKLSFHASTDPHPQGIRIFRNNLISLAQVLIPTYVTGEENEDIKSELKGVKLFVKRGSKPFADGILGHAKLLSDKTTSEERLLFRREPLWQVSMNIRMQPTVRCTFDAEENIVRLILKEAIEQKDAPAAEWEREVVVYALKPGRSCSKLDFKEFAETLVKGTAVTVQATQA
ncbi:hypothetical protein DXG03_000456 [Asterophora parasitica]|uniref:RanBD1 domain-containing protein n=1 Tax=Asterophora parasitica TaxID=117018 RepID=A0A9P7KH20_9AGAR|nr:hypothetical protein DXG03_000456 [Asterophora parasitica]